jgi:hypothetical protein
MNFFAKMYGITPLSSDLNSARMSLVSAVRTIESRVSLNPAHRGHPDHGGWMLFFKSSFSLPPGLDRRS